MTCSQEVHEAAAYALHKAGMDTLEISQRMNLSRQYVCDLLNSARKKDGEETRTRTGWTDDRVERLKKLHADGLSASQIAKQLGGVTRNAVIGKVDRLGMGRLGGEKASPPQRVPKAPPVKRAPYQNNGLNASQRKPLPALRVAQATVFEAAPVVPVVTKARAFQALPGSTPRLLVDLEPRHCRWPIDGMGEQHYCAQAAPDGQVYCPTHKAMSLGKQPADNTGNKLARSLRRWAA